MTLTNTFKKVKAASKTLALVSDTVRNDILNAVADAMTAKGYSFVSAQIEMVPQNYQTLESEEQISLMEKLLDIMEEDDDVQNVWHNWEE